MKKKYELNNDLMLQGVELRRDGYMIKALPPQLENKPYTKAIRNFADKYEYELEKKTLDDSVEAKKEMADIWANYVICGWESIGYDKADKRFTYIGDTTELAFTADNVRELFLDQPTFFNEVREYFETRKRFQMVKAEADSKN